MAFYEQEFIEIKREKAKMEIIGTMKCSVEQEDRTVRRGFPAGSHRSQTAFRCSSGRAAVPYGHPSQ